MKSKKINQKINDVKIQDEVKENKSIDHDVKMEEKYETKKRKEIDEVNILDVNDTETTNNAIVNAEEEKGY